jgi:hypothetical protein
MQSQNGMPKWQSKPQVDTASYQATYVALMYLIHIPLFHSCKHSHRIAGDIARKNAGEQSFLKRVEQAAWIDFY